MTKTTNMSISLRRSITTTPFHYERIKQTENEIVQMFQLSRPREDSRNLPTNQRTSRKSSARMLDERFIRILKIFKWGPDAEKALEVLKLRVDHRLVREVLNIDVDINVKMQFFKWAGKRRHFVHDSTTYMTLISCLSDSEMFGEMWKMIQEMVRQSVVIDPKDLSDIVRLLGKAKMVNKALSLFYQVKGRKCKPTASTYNSIILMLMQENHPEKVYDLYSEMCNEGNCFPDTITYSALMSAFAKLGHDNPAIRLFDEMKENGFHPNAKIYTTLLSIYFKAGKVEKALDLVTEMKEKGCMPTVYTYTELIRGLGKAGRVEESYGIYIDMVKHGCKPDVILINNVINILGKSGRLSDARKKKALLLLEEMDEKGFPPCPAAYCSLINTLGKAKRYEAANELFQELRENCGNSSSRVYAIMIKNLGKCGKLNEAKDLFNEIKKLGSVPDVYAYNALMSGMVRGGLIDEACSLMRDMEESGCVGDINSHNIILNGVAKSGGPHRAMIMFENMKRMKLKPDVVTYNTLLGCLSHAGMFEEAAKLMREMRSCGFEYDDITYSSILDAVGKIDDEHGTHQVQ
ncbi:unnamed protein product [Lactuca virosa]|nr:unnamed protein product [Lactuca virosa]